MMRTSEKGIKLIKIMEGFRARAYVCPGGVLTIGFGTTQGVTPGMVVSEHGAEVLLKQHLVQIERQLNALGLGINQHQFDALIDFIYNVGFGAFSRSSLLRLIRQNPNHPGIAAEFRKWRLANGAILPGLVKRREAEIALYNLPV